MCAIKERLYINCLYINLIQPRGIHLCCTEHLPGRGEPVHVHPHDRRVQPRRLGYQAPSSLIMLTEVNKTGLKPNMECYLYLTYIYLFVLYSKYIYCLCELQDFVLGCKILRRFIDCMDTNNLANL